MSVRFPRAARGPVTAFGAALLVTLALGAFRSPAAWHLHLKRAEPGVNDTVTMAPKVVRLWFTETPEAVGARIALTGPGGATVALGKPAVESGDDAPLAAEVKGAMMAGTYQVAWRAMARDGHAMGGTFRFVFRPASAGK